MIKTSNQNLIHRPGAVDGYCLDENKKYAFDYYPGYPYPDNVSDIMNEYHCDNNNSTNEEINENDWDFNLSSTDDEYGDEDEELAGTYD